MAAAVISLDGRAKSLSGLQRERWTDKDTFVQDEAGSNIAKLSDVR